MKTPTDTWSDRSESLALALARVGLGERAALETLYKATSAHLFGVILRINPDRGQAEDLLQDIFVNIWRAASGYDAARAQPMTWLTSIARNRAIDSLRRRKTEVATVSTHAVDDDGDEHDLLAAQPAADGGPLDLLLQAAAARQVTHCVGELSSEQQQCVALAYYQGYSHTEVAQHLTAGHGEKLGASRPVGAEGLPAARRRYTGLT